MTVLKLGRFFWWSTTMMMMMLSRVPISVELAEAMPLSEYSAIWTEEDVRFAEARCQLESIGTVAALKEMWANRIYPHNHKTHCYIKCLLSKLGLIDLETRGLDAHKFENFLQNIDEESDKGCFVDVNLEELLSGTCYSYYHKWITFRRLCNKSVDFIMFAVPNTTFIYAPQSKWLGQSAVEFCDFVWEDDSIREDSLRYLYYVTYTAQLNCKLSCIFKHFRYFDGYGRIDAAEIRRSFHEVSPSNAATIEAIRKCTHRANAALNLGACVMAKELYQCLSKSTKSFMEVYQKRDSLSRNY